MRNSVLVIIFILIAGCTVYSPVNVPGGTRANLKGKTIVAYDVFRTAKVVMGRQGITCNDYEKNYKILDTKFIREINLPHSPNPAWEESWILEACGKKWRAPVIFSGKEPNIISSTQNAYPAQ
jgi:hypothetical protein